MISAVNSNLHNENDAQTLLKLRSETDVILVLANRSEMELLKVEVNIILKDLIQATRC